MSVPRGSMHARKKDDRANLRVAPCAWVARRSETTTEVAALRPTPSQVFVGLVLRLTSAPLGRAGSAALSSLADGCDSEDCRLVCGQQPLEHLGALWLTKGCKQRATGKWRPSLKELKIKHDGGVFAESVGQFARRLAWDDLQEL